MHRVLTLITLVSFFAACARMAEVPREDIAASAGKTNKRGWQIDTHSGQRFLVKSYEVTDSTLVIGELLGVDEFYGAHQDITREIPLNDVSKVSRIRISPWEVDVLGFGLFVGLVALIYVALGGLGQTDT